MDMNLLRGMSKSLLSLDSGEQLLLYVIDIISYHLQKAIIEESKKELMTLALFSDILHCYCCYARGRLYDYHDPPAWLVAMEAQADLLKRVALLGKTFNELETELSGKLRSEERGILSYIARKQPIKVDDVLKAAFLFDEEQALLAMAFLRQRKLIQPSLHRDSMWSLSHVAMDYGHMAYCLSSMGTDIARTLKLFSGDSVPMPKAKLFVIGGTKTGER